MDQTSRFSSLGRQFRRTFIAFILSYFIIYVQIWLGIELFKLAQELARAGNYYGDEDLRKSSKLFRGARAVAFVAFMLGIITSWTRFGSPYGYSYSYSYGYYNQFALIMPIFRVIPIIIELGLLSAGWKYLYKFFAHDRVASDQSRFLGLKSTARVRWALGVSIAATVIELFTSNINNSYYLHDYFPYSYSSYIYLLPIVLTLLAGFLWLLGSINAGVGMYDTSKAFRNYQSITAMRPRRERFPEHDLRLRPSRDAYKELPFHPDNIASKKPSTEQSVAAPISDVYNSRSPTKQEKMKYCYNCGTLLPELAGLRFCPNCGIRVD